MNYDVHFEVSDHPMLASHKAMETLQRLGTPLKSDSGQYLTGMISFGRQVVDVRVSWLPSGAGSQITVHTTSDDPKGIGAFRVAERFRDAYLNPNVGHPVQARKGIPAWAYLMLVFASVIVTFLVVTIFKLGR